MAFPLHVYLLGFMGAGKTSVALELGKCLGMPHVDMDALVEQRAGMSVREIFEQQGEAAFRALESEVLDSIASGQPQVVATGGGAPVNPANLEGMRKSGLTVFLSASLEAHLARSKDRKARKHRPLLDQSSQQITELFRARQAVYRRAHGTIDTESLRPSRVAEIVAEECRRVVGIVDQYRERSTVQLLAGSSYPVVVADGVIDSVGRCARELLGPGVEKVAVITDGNVGPLYGDRAVAGLESCGFSVSRIDLPPGESSKSMVQFERLLNWLIEEGLDRSSAIVAVGGGVVGDIAGYVAASLYRGIPWIQVPTTLVAMTDSAIGGKTGINLERGKNLAGAFWQPRGVLADPRVLDTLPPRERRAALGELFKYGLLDGEELFESIVEIAPELVRDPLPSNRAFREKLAEIVLRCVGYKTTIVSRDEREAGDRALLNLGHTIGHAIEAAAGYGRLLHGEAVCLGLIAACRVSSEMVGASAEIEARVTAGLAAAGVDVNIDPWLRDEVLDRVRFDKKRTGNQLKFVVVEEVGNCAVNLVSTDRVLSILRPGARP